MQLLLDTHTFLWWVMDDARLSANAKSLLANNENSCYVSTISAWELVIKSALGKIKLAKPAVALFIEQTQASGFKQLDCQLAHIGLLESLPMHHRDPFDRLLIAQAQAEKLHLISADTAFDRYKIERLW